VFSPVLVKAIFTQVSTLQLFARLPDWVASPVFVAKTQVWADVFFCS